VIPVKKLFPNLRAESWRATTTSGVAAAGYPSKAYCLLVPSSLTAASATIRVPIFACGLIAPQVPTLIMSLTPSLASSSTAIAVEGPPMPVDIDITYSPST